MVHSRYGCLLLLLINIVRGKTVCCAIMCAVITVSQSASHVVMYNLTAAQAEEFIAEMMYVFIHLFLPLKMSRKYLNVFKDSPEFGWIEEKKDVRKMIRFHSRKFGTSNSVKAYACALKGDGKIDTTIPPPLLLLLPL